MTSHKNKEKNKVGDVDNDKEISNSFDCSCRSNVNIRSPTCVNLTPLVLSINTTHSISVNRNTCYTFNHYQISFTFQNNYIKAQVFNNKRICTSIKYENNSLTSLNLFITNKSLSSSTVESIIHLNNESIILLHNNFIQCYEQKQKTINNKCRRFKRNNFQNQKSSSTIVTFNSTSFIEYRQKNLQTIKYPLKLSLRFRTIGRISNGVLLSLTNRKNLLPSNIHQVNNNKLTISEMKSRLDIPTPYIVIEHSTSRIEVTILKFDNILKTVK
ncbi:unnamed protein product, partial [Didymodactylos carnosus]